MVYIGVIHPYHLQTCQLFTNAKKNVLCEKPLAMNAREVREILASAKKNNVFLMEVGMVHRRDRYVTKPHTPAALCFRLCGPGSSRSRLS